MLEASQYSDNAFITLTYSPENMPSDLSLEPDHLKNYLKRLRKKVAPLRFRYFACGEYGDGSFRPHYHLIAFGLPTCLRGVTTVNRRGVCCAICTLHADTWGLGNAYLGQVTDQSAAYTCGYVVKKLTGKEVQDYAGRHPEFSRMSNRPGIGAGFMDEVASTLMQHGLDETLEDVPTVLRHGRLLMPLGRYLTRRLRTRIGRDEKTPQSVLDKRQEELRPMRETAFAVALPGFKYASFREALINDAHGVAVNVIAKQRRRRKGSL